MARIAFVLPNMAGGGAERVTLTLIRDFLSHGHSIDLLLMTARGELLELVPDEVRIIDLKAPRIRNALLPLLRYFQHECPDSVHAAMWPLTVVTIATHRLARSRSRLIVSEHAALSMQYRSKLQRFLLRWTVRLLFPLADWRTACSLDSADDLAALAGIPRDSIAVLHNPVDLPSKIASNSQVEAFWGDAKERIVTVGTLKEQKNHVLLIRAFALLVKHRPMSRLLILGEGPNRSKLEALTQKLGISDSVIMPGFTLDPWPFYASADQFVLSSDYEGLPLVLIEALHAGLSVVSTDCLSGPKEILDNGRFGRLVRCGDPTALADAMDAALAQPHHRDQMKKRAAALAGPAARKRYAELLLG